MAKLNPIQAKIGGVLATPIPATSGGDTVAPGDVALLYTNGAGASTTITVVVPGNTEFGQPEPDVAIPLAAGAVKLIGPFPAELADPTDRLVHLSYTSATSLNVTPIKI